VFRKKAHKEDSNGPCKMPKELSAGLTRRLGVMDPRNSIAHKTKYNNLSHYSVGNSIDNLGNICCHNIRNKGGGCMGMDSHNKKEQGYIPHIPSPKRVVKLLK
jgi:hypothetical protein